MNPPTISALLVGATITDVLVDSEKTIIVFSNGAILEGAVGWVLTWEGTR